MVNQFLTLDKNTSSIAKGYCDAFLVGNYYIMLKTRVFQILPYDSAFL